MVKIVSVSIRDYVYDKIFPLDKDFKGINKSARIEELISKGLEKEHEDLHKK